MAEIVCLLCGREHMRKESQHCINCEIAQEKLDRDFLRLSLACHNAQFLHRNEEDPKVANLLRDAVVETSRQIAEYHSVQGNGNDFFASDSPFAKDPPELPE